MVMNTFRSKLRRRRDELFRRGSDDSDEWQFVPFNPSVYPANNNNSLSNLTNNNGASSPGDAVLPPTPKPALRPWAMQRASWHECQPPVPPHGHGSVVKGHFPLPPCPDGNPPPLPPHGFGYPGSVPNWYGSQFPAPPVHYPASVPPGQSRPSPVVLRRAAQVAQVDERRPEAGPRPPADGLRPPSSGLPLPSDLTRPPSGGPPLPSDSPRPPSGDPPLPSEGPRPPSGGSLLPSEGPRPLGSGPPLISEGPRPPSGGPPVSSAGSRGGSRPSSGCSKGGSRPSSGSFDVIDGVLISPEGPPPQVPPHGRPAVPPHLVSPRNNMPPASFSTTGVLPPPPTVPIPPPPVPAHASDTPDPPGQKCGPFPRYSPNPVPASASRHSLFLAADEGPRQPHAPGPATVPFPGGVPRSRGAQPPFGEVQKPHNLNLDDLAALLAPGYQASSDQEASPDSPEYKQPVDQSPEYKSPCDSGDEDSPGDKGGSGVGGPAWGSGKEQRRSDPGTVTNHHANSTSAAPTANANSHAASSTTSSSTGLELANNGSENLDEYGSPDSSSTNVCSTDSAPLAALNKHNLPKKKSSTSINRSESCKEKQHARKRPRESRKHSDPNIPTSKSGDVDAESGLISGNSGSSSNSSLSPSQESPSTSLEHVSRADVPLPAPVLENDSDIEAELDLPNWQKLVSHDQIKRLKPKERKRQDTINELFHTERTHVRVLKVLKHLFHLPMLEAGILSKEQSEMLFPNIEQILEIHTTFNQAMKKRREEEPLVIRVGDLLVNMFDGEQGEHFQQQAAEFIRMQGIALENLKQKQKRDQRLSAFLQEQENNPACRRLQLKDMLPAGFQRLSKYPLLIESLLAYTDSNKQPEEYEQISRALERSKEILAYVNAAVQEAENNQKLSEIQRRLDQSSLAKNKHGHSDELRGNLDLTKHKLIYEGPLTWRIAKGQKNIDLHVLLLDEFIVLLQKADDKYILKNHSINKSLGKDDNKLTHSPIIKYGPSMLFRAVATDRCAFFIVTTQSGGAHIYELVTISANERKVWFRHIQEAQEAYGARDGRNRRSQPPTPLPDPDDHPGSSGDALRDVDDDVDGGETADGTNDISGDTKAQSGSGKAAEPVVKPEEPLSSTSTASQPPASSETLANKTAEADGASSGSSGPGGPSPSAGRSPASGRRLQEVQIIQIVEGPTLIQPSEVKVSQGVVLSAEPVLTPIEHLRRKDLKIRQALEEKQHIIADILNIPHEHFENVADMAGEPAVGNKEPRELVLAAMYQAKCLQETLNEALNIRESDIVAARANNDSANKLSSLPLYQAPMTKLMAISTSLSQQLSSLLNLVSERDDERDRMRKELVASRERLHLLHMRQNSLTNQTSTPTQHSDITTSTSTIAATPPTATSPHTSRPSSFVSVASSVPDHSDSLDHHDTDEEGRGDAPKVNSTHQEEGEDSKEGSVAETFEDAVSGSEPADAAAGEGEHSSGNRECLGDGAAVRGPEGITESSTT